jgi:site-specific DNA recombinase
MIRVAFYARVSSDLQERENTIDSQLEALRAYAHHKGYQVVDEYLDDGYSGATLARPGLDRLRDALSSGEFDLVLFHHPDRLARRVVYQYLVLEEMEKAGVKPEFLNFPLDDSPESQLLLGMQGVISEYDRAKILERTRRGKLHHARAGALVGGHAPYGYRWIRSGEQGRARLEIVEYSAAVVRRMYRMLLEERLSSWAIARRLTREGVPTSRGAAQWQPMAVIRLLRNTVYKGLYRYRHSEHEDILIPVSAIIDEATWQAAQDQLESNRQYSSRNNRRNQYLLRGLIRCTRCGGNYSGYMQHGSRGYRCARANRAVSSTGQRCAPGAIPAQPVEDAVWEAVKDAMQQPQLLVEEYTRRLKSTGSANHWELETKQIGLALKKVKSKEDRMTDAYRAEAIDLSRFKTEMDKLANRRKELERIQQEIEHRSRQDDASRKALEQLEAFCNQIKVGLETLTFEERQQFLRLVVEGITVADGRVKVETVIPIDQTGKLRNARGEPVEP